LRRCPYRYEENPLPSISRYLGGLLKSRSRRIMTAGMAVPVLLLAVAACGGSASASPARATARAEPRQFVGSGRRERLSQLPAPAWRDRFRQRQLERKQLERKHAEQQHD
jgi:hypothetical protein